MTIVNSLLSHWKKYPPAHISSAANVGMGVFGKEQEKEGMSPMEFLAHANAIAEKNGNQ